MHRFLSILLAIMVFSCPLRCQLGWSDCCGQTAELSLGDCCCSDTETEIPVRPEKDTEERCGCICSGATMPDATDLITQASVPFDFAVLPFLLNVKFAEQGNVASSLRSCRTEIPMRARNLGRQMRCLHSSFII